MSIESAVVRQLPPGEQLILDGFPVIRGNTRFSLTNDKKLITDRVLAYNDHIEGTFSGRVRGVIHTESGGELIATFLIEVLEAELG